MPENTREFPARKKWLRLYLGTLASIFSFFLLLWSTASLLPKSKTVRMYFLEENNLLELISLSFLVVALLLAIHTLIRFRYFRNSSVLGWLFPFSIFLLICEETSFGRVYYDWYAPLPICGAKFDAFHDALVVIPHCLPQLGISKTAFSLAIGLLLLLVLLTASFFALKKKEAIFSSLRQTPFWFYLGASFLLLWLGGGLEFITEIDAFGIEKSDFIVFLEEAFETLAEYNILFSAIIFFRMNNEKEALPPSLISRLKP